MSPEEAAQWAKKIQIMQSIVCLKKDFAVDLRATRNPCRVQSAMTWLQICFKYSYSKQSLETLQTCIFWDWFTSKGEDKFRECLSQTQLYMNFYVQITYKCFKIQ